MTWTKLSVLEVKSRLELVSFLQSRSDRWKLIPVVWINTHFDVSPVIPFGGHKQSGLGVEWGVAGMKGMCNQQTVNIHKIN
jgi:hypothetical protein